MNEKVAIRFAEWCAWNFNREGGTQDLWRANFGNDRSLKSTTDLFERFKLSETYKELSESPDAGEGGCICSPDQKHGETSIMCCNHCGKPTEQFWIDGMKPMVTPTTNDKLK